MLGIIIVNYKSEPLTVDYIKNEISKIKQPHVVIVVNNEATMSSNEFLCENLNATLITNIKDKIAVQNSCYIISSNENLGFARGNNLASTFLQLHFGCKYILFSNNDIKIVNNDVCELLIEKMEEIHNIGMIGPKIVGHKGELQSPEPYMSFWERYCWMYLFTPFMTLQTKRRRFKLDYAENAMEGFHYKIMGSFFMVRFDDFYNCGMMDTNTFLYAEESILAERMKNINKGVYYLPSVSVIHAHGITTNNTIGKRGINKYLMDSEIYYYKTYIHTSKYKLWLGRIVYQIIKALKG